MNKLLWIPEAFRIFRRSLHVKRNGVKKYKGNAEQICRKIVKDCWNGRYFQVSSGHFCQFYMRDFGFCIDSLLKLGYKKEVRKTLEYAMEIYFKQGLKTTITPKGKAVDIFMYSPDTLAYLIRSLRVAKAKDLAEKYRNFLAKEVKKFNDLVIDKETGLVREDKYFGSMKDEAKRRGSCYDNIMAAMLSNELDKLGLFNPFKKYDFKKAIKHLFWTGEYFIDDLKGNKKIVTGDANVFPFWSNVFDNNVMVKKAIKKIQGAKLDVPFPLKYSSVKEHEFIFVNMFVPNYETNTCWMHMGPLYVQVVKQVDKKKARRYKKKYKEIIEKHHNFLELFDEHGKPFKSKFYYADEGMLWAANYLTL
ncbi:hypothetical protein KY332_00325 [Candidatus Woesearchaeota archaeon]|nr:hypothetical protein [Candidatus Woesearchaeota archaeon]